MKIDIGADLNTEAETGLVWTFLDGRVVVCDEKVKARASEPRTNRQSGRRLGWNERI